LALSDDFLAGMLELSRIMIHQDSLEDALQKITDLAASTLGAVDGVGLTLVEGVGPRHAVAEGKVGKVAGRSSTPLKVRTAAYSSDWVVDVDETQYEAGEGPCLHAIADGKSHEVPDVSKDDKYPEFSESASKQGVQSALALPLKSDEKVTGAMNLYSRQKEAFDQELVKLAEAFATHVAAAIGNIDSYKKAVELAENLQQAMESRATIEQAKGMIMLQRKCTDEEAFQTLVAASQARNQKLRDIAAEVVEAAMKDDL
jgi:GAF domain-containing protein